MSVNIFDKQKGDIIQVAGNAFNNTDTVARNAIAAHEGNADIHVTAAEKASWNGKAELSDIPTTLPANGGNSDMVDNKHAVDIMNMGNFAANRTLIPANTDLDTMLIGGKFLVDSHETAETITNSPFTENGYYFDVMRHSSTNVLQIATLWTGMIKLRSYIDGTWNKWFNISDYGNADMVDGKHAADFLPNKAECVNGANYDDFAVSGFYEVLGTADSPTQNSPTGNETDNNFYLMVQRRSNSYCSQIAVSVRNDKSVYIRNKCNNIWNSWTKIEAGNSEKVNGKTIEMSIYRETSSLGVTNSDTANKIWGAIPDNSIFATEAQGLTDSSWNFPTNISLYSLLIIKLSNVRPLGIYLYPKTVGSIYYAYIGNSGEFTGNWKVVGEGCNASKLEGHAASDFVLKSDYNALLARVEALEN